MTQKKTPDRAGATPLFCGRAAQKLRGVAPARHAGSVTVFCPRAQRELSRKTTENHFSVGDTLISPRDEYVSKRQTSLFSEAKMADYTDHELTHHTPRRTELGSVGADFLWRTSAASSFLRASLNSRDEKRFTPVLHGSLHRSLARARRAKLDKLIR